jgi:hypothetical protein
VVRGLGSRFSGLQDFEGVGGGHRGEPVVDPERTGM